MTVGEQMNLFAERYGKRVSVNGMVWRYYCLGAGAPILWLTGGLRRAALRFAFMQRLAARHRIIAPDYPPVQTLDEYMQAFDAILRAEEIGDFALGGQSYGALLAQAYLAYRRGAVERLVLSSSGPADYGRAWLPVEHFCLALARLLPEKGVKKLWLGGLLKVITLPETERAEWQELIQTVVDNDLSRADVISHFAVAADLIRQGIVTPAAYRTWAGRVIILRAENDPTQNQRDILRYTRLFGRTVEVVNLGEMGHAAAIFDPDAYTNWLELALA